MIDKLFGKSLERLEQALDVRNTRHGVIMSNITNQDTPGYKAKEIDFKKALADADSGAGGLKVAQTNAKHISTHNGASSISPEVRLSATNGAKRLDGNTVNTEKEMTRLAENTFMYQATAEFIARKFAGLKNVISEGR
ncbi:hypothetical protein MNBD_NITROSPIRAE01-687 [hydrothermal vent metagenome]|uniref:Flagellar basal-body rod protein FlgB n=1 Tax=hydrothermal vent metagenome TaxID=652676 RepID=A0A3B1CJN7_9ZZZZ